MEAGPGEKCEKVTLKPEKETLEQPEQSRTKLNKNTEMKAGEKKWIWDLNKWMDPSSANCPKDNYTNKSRVENGRGSERQKVAFRREKGA